MRKDKLKKTKVYSGIAFILCIFSLNLTDYSN